MEENIKQSIMEDHRETLDNVYKTPKNLLFIAGPDCAAKQLVLEELNDVITTDLPFVKICPTIKVNRPEYMHKDNKCSSFYPDLLLDIGEYGVSYYESCKLAKDNPDKIIINAQCPFDWNINAHTLRGKKYLGEDEHYMLCAIFQTTFEPWHIINFRTIMIYPDLFTLLEDYTYNPYKDIIASNRDSFVEDLHMNYHTFMIDDLAKHMPYFELIESSHPKKRLTDITNMIQIYKREYDKYVKENTEEYMIHPAINNDDEKAMRLKEALKKHLG